MTRMEILIFTSLHTFILLFDDWISICRSHLGAATFCRIKIQLAHHLMWSYFNLRGSKNKYNERHSRLKMKTYLHNVPDIRSHQFFVKRKWKTQSVQAATQRIVKINTEEKKNDFYSVCVNDEMIAIIHQRVVIYFKATGKNHPPEFWL